MPPRIQADSRGLSFRTLSLLDSAIGKQNGEFFQRSFFIVCIASDKIYRLPPNPPKGLPGMNWP